MTQANEESDPAWPGTDPVTQCPVAHNGPLPLQGARFRQSPGELYRQLRREHGPVAPVTLEGGLPAWFVIGYRELHQVLSNSQLFARDCRRWHAWDQVPENWSLLPFVGYQPSVMFTEGAEHQRRSGAISDALFEVDQFELRTSCEQIADRLIDAFSSMGEVDLMAHYAHPMPLLVVAKLFGLPDAEAPDLLANMTASLDGRDDAVKAHEQIMLTMRQLAESRRERPGADVPSRMLAHPAGLTDDEVVLDLLVVMTAAQQPTANWIGNTLRLMLTDSRFAATLSGGRSSAGQALNEVLWEDTPTQNYLGRWASRPTQLGGQRIEAGDLLVLGFAAANTDPQVRPDSYTGPEGNRAQMSFSHGEHRCPYPAPELAQVIAQVAIEVLLDRLPDVVLAGEPEDLAWRESVWMRGLESLPVRFTPAFS